MMHSLFSYGTLQLDAVQMATFGRILEGRPDQLPGFECTLIAIDNPDVVATSGATHHPIVSYSGRNTDSVPGTVFSISHEELLHADRYEVDAYRRIAVTLASGLLAWVYVNAEQVPPAAGPIATP